MQINQPTAQLIQLGANVVLAIFTVVLAWATWQYTKAAKKQVEAESRPYLKPATQLREGGTAHFLIENIGNGTAHNVTVEWRIEGWEKSKRSWSVPIFRSDKHASFAFPLGGKQVGASPVGIHGIETALEEQGVEGEMIVDLTYKDALGKTWSPENERFNILKELRSRTEANEIYTGEMNLGI